jgi:aerobic carbon-monoxide dehydrogenase medium subunit
MKASAFEYHAPRSLGEATELLARYRADDARVLAGGQSLVPAMALRVASPAHLIDINGIDELDRLTAAGDGCLCVRACVRHAAFHRPVESGPLGTLLARVVRYIAHYPIRTRGTLCGSLAHADPASEWCLVAATLDAELAAASGRGTRTVPVRDWFLGLMTTALEPDELLLEVRFKPLPADTLFGFEEFSRRAGDFALAMALVTFRVQSGVIAEPRVGVGAVEPVPRRLPRAEDALRGRAPGSATFEKAANAAAEAVEPLTDARYDAAYRRDLTRTMVRRALQQAWSRSAE